MLPVISLRALFYEGSRTTGQSTADCGRRVGVGPTDGVPGEEVERKEPTRQPGAPRDGITMAQFKKLHRVTREHALQCQRVKFPPHTFLLFILVASMAGRAAETAGHDEIWFGTVPVQLSTVPGKCINYLHEEWAVAARSDQQALRQTRGRTQRLRLQGEGGQTPDVVIPAIPSLEIVAKCTASSDVSSWPEQLQRPLVKTAVSGAESPLSTVSYKAIASGCRSCLVQIPDQGWVRLKGCGNHDEGFIVRTSGGGAGAEHERFRDIRGSAFLHTALRENYMTALLSSSPGTDAVTSANQAMGVYVYGAPRQPLGEDVPLCCIVERTLGDRRLGTHALAGMEVLLPLLLRNAMDPAEEAASAAALLAHFPAARPGRSNAQALRECTTAALVTDHMIAWEMSGCPLSDESRSQGLQWPHLRRDVSTFGTFASYLLPVVAPVTRPQQWANAGPMDMQDRWFRVWDATCQRLAAFLQEQDEGVVEGRDAERGYGGGSSVLGYLFSRLGYECGRFLGALHRQRISWGTYQVCWRRRRRGRIHSYARKCADVFERLCGTVF